MNKKVSVFMSSLFLLFLVGCGKNGNELVCSQEKFDGYKHDLIIKYNSDKTEVIGAEIKAVVKIKEGQRNHLGCKEDQSDEDCLKQLMSDVENSCNESDAKIKNCKISKKSKYGFTFTATVKDESLQEYFQDFDLKSSMEDLKKSIESYNEDIICK